MIRLLPIILLAACSGRGPVLSSINFVPEEVDPNCAIGSVNDEEGLALVSSKEYRGGRTRAVFSVSGEEELLLNIRKPRWGGNEVFVSVTPSEPDNALNILASRLAVEAADEAIYVNCTEDGRTYGGPTVVIEGQKE